MNKSVSKYLGGLVCAGLLFLLLVMVINTAVIGYAEPYILTMSQAEAKNADCVLVPGAKVYRSGNLSAVLEDRVKTGISLYKNHSGKKLLLSGDHGQKQYDEVNSMKKYALESNVPLDDIFLDHAGFSTYESMYRAQKVFGVKEVVIVTQTFHLYRAVYIARRLGMDAYGVSSSLRPYLTQNYMDLREIPARFKDFFAVIFLPKPTYLGDPIDISASGAQTHD